jgi:hypothetical protein
MNDNFVWVDTISEFDRTISNAGWESYFEISISLLYRLKFLKVF